ncbi:unnamed protein product [Sphagnum jensenii]
MFRLVRLNDVLPVTATRKAKWYYSTFHNVTAIVSAGVLGLPTAMADLTWCPGIVLLILSWVIALFNLWKMVEMHEIVPGKRFDRYHELGQAAFGKRLGLWIVLPQQLLVEVSVDIVYSTIAWAIPVNKGNRQAQDYHLPHYGEISPAPGPEPPATANAHTAHQVLSIFNASGVIAFAYAGHNVVLEIQATLPSSPERPSKIAMWRGVVWAYVIVAACYFPVAIICYWAYGNQLAAYSNILQFHGTL